eukprot:Nitzschia sp. Nitz4//scaffold348_size17284//11002//11742//NITZ4_008843-RA/size17284-processed-gene-0.11-mRNA-1//-1//CDS//3329548691//5960//frame0
MSVSQSQLTQINNFACQAFEAGDYPTAASHFKHALSQSRGFIQQQGIQQNSSSSPRIMRLPAHLCQGLQSKPCTLEAEDQLSVHRRTIRLVDGYKFSENSLDNSTVITAVIVFNLALTSHIQGLQFNCQRNLKQASALYSHTYQLVHSIVNETYQGCSTGNALFDLLVLALYNNMALVYLEFSQPEQAASVFQHLMKYASTLSFLQGLEPSVPGTSGPSEIHRDIDSFVLNATLLGYSTTNAAAAA